MASSSSSTVKDLTEANKKFFNENAATYENHTRHAKLMQVIAEAVLKSKEWSGVAWDEDNTRMMDYACGTGIISRILAPYTKQLIGMDISDGMVAEFNKTVDNQGIPPEEMRAIVADLCADKVDPSLSDPEYYNFDVAISTMALHHFSNVPLAIKRIVERLKPETGVLLVIDFRTHKQINPALNFLHESSVEEEQHIHQHGHHQVEQHIHQHDHRPQEGQSGLKLGEMGFHAGAHTVTHSGFSEEEIKRWYEEAGLVDVEIVDAGSGKGVTMVGKDPKTGEVDTVERRVFMAKGRRA